MRYTVPCYVLVCPEFPSSTPSWDALRHTPTLYLRLVFVKLLAQSTITGIESEVEDTPCSRGRTGVIDCAV